MTRYYVDTCIWIDYWADRKNFFQQPIGRYAAEFFLKILKRSDKIIISDQVLTELRNYMYDEDIEELFRLFYTTNKLHIIQITVQDIKYAQKISIDRKIPDGDAIHAIIASQNDAILITRDKHFRRVKDIVSCRKPEEVL